MEAINDELNKYKNIERFIYKTDNRDGGTFAIPSIIGSILNVFLGTIFLIIDIIATDHKTLPIVFLILNAFMVITFYFCKKRHPSDGTYKYSFFLPGLYLGLSGVYSSIVFLYIIYEMLYMVMGLSDFVKSYMAIVVVVYLAIILIQYMWYAIAFKKGYYSDDLVSSIQIRRRMETIAKILCYPVGVLYVAIAPFTYILTRIIVHTVDSYPLQNIIFATVLLIIPLGTAMSYPVFIWWYLIRKYRKYIPEKSWHR